MAQGGARRRPTCHDALFVTPVCPAMTAGASAEIGGSGFIGRHWAAPEAMRLSRGLARRHGALWNSRKNAPGKPPFHSPSRSRASGMTRSPRVRETWALDLNGAREETKKTKSWTRCRTPRVIFSPNPGGDPKASVVGLRSMSSVCFRDYFSSSRMIVSCDEADRPQRRRPRGAGRRRLSPSRPRGPRPFLSRDAGKGKGRGGRRPASRERGGAQPSAVVGSIMRRISVILLAGKPLRRACSRMMSSSLAR
jgi:hypothetical protein